MSIKFNRSVLLATLLSGTMLMGSASPSLARVERQESSPAAVSAAAFGVGDACFWVSMGSGLGSLMTPKALVARSLGWAGLAATVGCYTYDQLQKVTPAQKRASLLYYYNKYRAMTPLQKLDAFGYSCTRVYSGGGGTDKLKPNSSAAAFNSTQSLTAQRFVVQGITYNCITIRD